MVTIVTGGIKIVNNWIKVKVEVKWPSFDVPYLESFLYI